MEALSFTIKPQFQERNPHDLTIDMQEEMIGYKNNIELLKNGYQSVLPKEAAKAYEIYKKQF